jgi:hypothetical protein
MVSNLKSETARANGAKSRGPTTPEGKEKSSRNALKHGLTAGTGNILLDCEDPAEFEQAFNKLFGIHEPATPAEKDIVEEMVAARWRIRRMWTIETNLFNVEILTQQSNPSISEAATPGPGIHLALAYRALSDDSRSLALASRYEARLQRLYDRAYKTLRELQQARKLETPEQPHTIRVMWVDQPKKQDQSHNPSPTDAEIPNEPTAAEPRASASGPTEEIPNEPTTTEPRASASGPTPTELPNEPTAAEVVAQPFVPVFPKAEPPTDPGTPHCDKVISR